MPPIFCIPPQKYKILLEWGVWISTSTVQEILDWTTIVFHSRRGRAVLCPSHHFGTRHQFDNVKGGSREQRPIYFVGKTFTDCKMRHFPLEKLVLALIMTSRKLMHYFQAHPIAVYTEFSLKNILSKEGLSRRLSKWVIKLGQSDINFLPRVAIKG